MNKGTASKKERLYECVWQLHLKGTDLGQIRMSEVAELSGIPKGTIYEHFRSKDQLIAESMVWFLEKEAMELQRRITEADSFDVRMDVVLEWVASPSGRSLLMKDFADDGRLPEGLRREFLRCGQESGMCSVCLNGTEMVTKALEEAGKKEGILTDGSQLARKTALYSTLAPVVMYTMFPERYEETCWEKVKVHAKRIFVAAFETD